VTLKFQDAQKEAEFTKHKDPYAAIYSAVCPAALVAVALANFFSISFTFLGLVVLIVGVIVLGVLSSFSACEDSPVKSRVMVCPISNRTRDFYFQYISVNNTLFRIDDRNYLGCSIPYAHWNQNYGLGDLCQF